MGSHWILEHFQKTQLIFLIVAITAAWLSFRSRESRSQFRTREADRPDLKQVFSKPAPATKATPLALPGIRLTGEPHEILGIDRSASEGEILKAYKDAIKQYHPDRIQGQAQEQMKFYQDAAAKLNEAKEAMLKARKGGQGSQGV